MPLAGYSSPSAPTRCSAKAVIRDPERVPKGYQKGTPKDPKLWFPIDSWIEIQRVYLCVLGIGMPISLICYSFLPISLICHIFLIEENLPHLPHNLWLMWEISANLPHMWEIEMSHICHIFPNLPHIITPISGRFRVGEFATYVGDVGDVGDSL